MQLSVWVPNELAEALKTRLPGVNVSKVLQDGLRSLLDCEHDQLVCADCAAPVNRRAITDDALSKFYSQVMWEIRDLVAAGGTCEGAGRIVKGVAEAHQVSAAKRVSLPRPPRGVRERREWERRWLEQQAG